MFADQRLAGVRLRGDCEDHGMQVTKHAGSRIHEFQTQGT